jgi:hypothetical protein
MSANPRQPPEWRAFYWQHELAGTEIKTPNLPLSVLAKFGEIWRISSC